MQPKMRKSCSLASVRFDLNQFSVGESRIQTLPIRSNFVRPSTSDSEKHTNIKEWEQLLVSNRAYAKENEQLKKQIDSLRRSLASANASTVRPNYKELLHNKSRCNSRVATECETDLFSSKEVSLETSEQSVEEYFKKFSSQGPHTSFEELEEVARRFFKQYLDNYSKLAYMVGTFRPSQAGFQELSDTIGIYKVPLVYSGNPKLLMRQLSREKSHSRRKQEICLESLSPDDTVKKFEGIVRKFMKSPKLLAVLSSNEVVRQFVCKCSELSVRLR